CVDGYLETCSATRAVVHGRLATWMLRTIDNDQDVGVQLLGVRLDDVVECRPAAFLLAMQDDFDVLRRLATDCIHRRYERLDRAFVVTGGPGVDAPAIRECVAFTKVADLLCAFVNAAGSQYGLEWVRLFPFRLVDQLTVIVDVEQNSARRSRD